MSLAPVSVHDASKIASLSLPSTMRTQQAAPTKARGDLELSMPSITFSAASTKAPQVVIQPLVAKPPEAPRAHEYHGWFVPLAYLHCGLILCMSNLLAPGWTRYCARFLCPLWTAGLLLHAATHSGFYLGWGVGLILLYPCVVELADGVVGALYVLLFAGFASGAFWREQHGVLLVLTCACWLGLLGACGWVLADPENPAPGVTLAGFCANIASLVCTRRVGRLVFKVPDCG